ncbi:site-specific integrase [Granulicella sp. S190]|uniref:tyrosine-type recombinase/integrase n=1 Tax=Granulicella sp. S190 TaxID=1747226 RepID=UPI00131D50AA|nr:site-specific integrase [Granulicella sp. S190]
MAVYKRGKYWWYHFNFAGRNVQESAKTTSKTIAKELEQRRRREMEEGFGGIERERKDRVRTLADLSADYFKEYQLRNRAHTFAKYAIGHLCRHLGAKMLVQIDATVVTEYQTKRLEEKSAPKSVNDEVGMLLRIMSDRGDLLRNELKRKKLLKLKVGEQPGKAFDVAEKDRMLQAAEKSRSPLILPALTLALNAGMRDAEIKTTRWSQVDFAKLILTVGQSKTDAGTGRTIPLNSEILPALLKHAKWYTTKFGELRPEWFVFPFGRRGHMDPTRSVTSLKTAWNGVRATAKVQGRWHDARHTLITELAESGAGNETIKAIAGHVSQQMLDRYSHIRTEAKRSALEDVVTRRHTIRRARSAAAEKAAQAVAVN